MAARKLNADGVVIAGMGAGDQGAHQRRADALALPGVRWADRGGCPAGTCTGAGHVLDSAREVTPLPGPGARKIA
jgi:hypothetical protein